jgi:hypothetical protein
MQAALAECHGAEGKRAKCAAKGEAALKALIAHVQGSLAQLESAAKPEAACTGLAKKIEDAGLLKDLNSTTKDFHGSIAKLGKAGRGRAGNRGS